LYLKVKTNHILSALSEICLSCRIVSKYDDLLSLEQEWAALLKQIPDANLFYSPELLLPAIKLRLIKEPWKIIFVFEEGKTLIGIIPLMQYPARGLWPFRHWGLMQHRHCFLCNPVILREFEEVLCRAFVASNHKTFFNLPYLRTSTFPLSVLETTYKIDSFARPVFDSRASKAGSFGEYLKEILSSNDRKKIRSKEKKLLQLTATSFEKLSTKCSVSELSGWIEDFLSCEASGWKSQEGNALKNNPQDLEYFKNICSRLNHSGSLQFSRLRSSNNETLAIRCAFRKASHEFVFKIAYNQAYSNYSPGLLLELEVLKDFYAQTEGELTMDSCLSSPNRTFSLLWNQSYLLATSVLSPKTFFSKAFFKLLVFGRNASKLNYKL